MNREPRALHDRTLSLSVRAPSQAEGVAIRQRLREAGVTSVDAAVLSAVLAEWEAAHPAAQQRSEMLDAWDVVDEDGDGRVSGTERVRLFEMLTTYGEPLTDEEAEAFFAELDGVRAHSARALCCARRAT